MKFMCAISNLCMVSTGKHFNVATLIGGRLATRRCNHLGAATPRECLLALVKEGNPGAQIDSFRRFFCLSMIDVSCHSSDHLCMGAQHPKLRDKLRKIPGTPLLFISGQTPLLEPPSEKTMADVHVGVTDR